MIRCIHLVKSAQPECTGICRSIQSIGEFSKHHGYDISLLFLAPGPLQGQFQSIGIDADAVSWNGKFSDIAGAIRAFIWLRRRRPAIVHVHWGGRMMRAICKLSGAKVVIQHVHGRINELTGEIPKEISFPLADAVVACSKAVALSIRSRRLEVIYAGIKANPTPQFLKDHKGPLQIGVLSRLTPIKKIESVIQAVAQLKHRGLAIEISIAGSGPSEYKLKHIANSLKVADRINFLGWQKNIDQLLSTWDLLVIPSLDEGFPISVLEAMGAARPIVGSRVGGIPEIVLEGVTGYLIEPNDIDALVRRLSELANNRAKLAEMGVAGWKRVREEFSEETFAMRITRFYDQLYKT